MEMTILPCITLYIITGLLVWEYLIRNLKPPFSTQYYFMDYKEKLLVFMVAIILWPVLLLTE